MYSSDSENTFANDIKRYLPERSDQLESEVATLQTLSIAVDRWTPCATVVPPLECQAAFGESRCIDVLVKSISLQLDIYDVSSNRLPIPRSNQVRFFSEIPKSLLLYNPQFTATYDERAGLQPAASVSTNLLARSGTQPGSGSDAGVTRPTDMWLKWDGAKAVDATFFSTRAARCLSCGNDLRADDRVGAAAAFNASLEPLGDDDDHRDPFRERRHRRASPGVMFSRLRLGGGYRWTRHRFADVDGSPDSLSENAIQASLVADGHVAGGFTRIAAWIDGASPTTGDAYARLAASIGYEKELPVAQNQAVGLEGIVGFGEGFGSLPAHTRAFMAEPHPNFSIRRYRFAVADVHARRSHGPQRRAWATWWKHPVGRVDRR